MTKHKKIKICLACSAGGHLQEMLQLESVYKKHTHFFISFKRIDTESLSKKELFYCIERPARNPAKTIKNFVQTLKILQKENPDLIISTGADVALASCFIGKLLGKKVIFIESFCRPIKPGITGKLIYQIADLFLYQWKALKKYYKKGIYSGSIFQEKSKSKTKDFGKGIFLSVGTHPQQFNRLLKIIDDLIEKKIIKEKVFAQIGASDYKPKHFDYERFIELNEFEQKIKKCSLFITHAGEGNIGLALNLGKKMLVMPRLKKFDEHTNNHQLELADAIEKEKLALIAHNENELKTALAKIKNFNLNQNKLKGSSIKLINDFIKQNFK